jgi:UDP-glucose 4-epimerase
MRVLVTGGAGFIGSNLANKLSSNGQKVYVVDDLSRGKKEFLDKGIDLITAKIESKEATSSIRKIKPGFIVHLAAELNLAESLKNPQADLQKNLFPILPLLDVSREVKIKKFIFASSAAVFGVTNKLPVDEFCKKQPLSPYGLSKLTCEYYLEYINRHFNLPYATLRFANVYGPNQNSTAEGGVVAIFISKVLSGSMPIIYGDGEQTRDFIYVEDAVDAIIASLLSQVSGDFNVGTTKETTINQLFEIICKVTRKKVSAKYETEQEFGVAKNALSYKKIESQLKWKPKIKLENGIKQTIDFMRK